MEWLLPQRVPEGKEGKIYIKFSMDGARMTNRGRRKEEAVGMEIIVPGDSLSTLKSPDNCHQVGLGVIKEDYDLLKAEFGEIFTEISKLNGMDIVVWAETSLLINICDVLQNREQNDGCGGENIPDHADFWLRHGTAR